MTLNYFTKFTLCHLNSSLPKCQKTIQLPMLMEVGHLIFEFSMQFGRNLISDSNKLFSATSSMKRDEILGFL